MDLGFATFAKQRAGKQVADPQRVLQWIDPRPCLMDDRGGERRRQVAGLIDDRAPFREARILVPVEVIDKRIAFAGRKRAQSPFAGKGLIGVRDGSVERSEQFGESVVVGNRRLEVGIFVFDGFGFFALEPRRVDAPYPPSQCLDADR